MIRQSYTLQSVPPNILSTYLAPHNYYPIIDYLLYAILYIRDYFVTTNLCFFIVVLTRISLIAISVISLVTLYQGSVGQVPFYELEPLYPATQCPAVVRGHRVQKAF